MPAVRVYIVRQEREVKVRAESPADAVKVGTAAFRGEDHDFREIGGSTTSEVRETETSAREDY